MENTGIETYIENDTAMVGLGEAAYGAGKDFDIVAYLTISTGVGGARIVGRRIDANVFGFEPGHQIIDADGTMCPDCRAFEDDRGLGHLEAHISGSAIEKRFGKHPSEIDDEKVWDDLARYLAYGLNNTIVHWSPEVVVLGGGMMKSTGIKIERIDHYLEDILKIFPERPLLKLAELGDVGGLFGGLSYIKQLQKQ
jgi:predicted NBD/HSP70 family sugar kinase